MNIKHVLIQSQSINVLLHVYTYIYYNLIRLLSLYFSKKNSIDIFLSLKLHMWIHVGENNLYLSNCASITR